MRLVTNYPTRDLGREVDYEAMKRNALYDQGVLVAKLNDPRLDDFDRQILKNIGGKLYPRRA